MPGIFFSYRRDDTQGFAGRLAHDLSRALGPEQVFSDIEIPFGSDFGEVLHRAIAASDALLVVIGRRWATDAGEGRRSRLFDADDWVRTEIEAALSQGKVIIPVLVGGAVMPPAMALPETIQQLTRIQAASFEDRHWDADLASLIARLRPMVPGLGEAGHQAGSHLPAESANESLAQVLREIAQRVLDESRARSPERLPPRSEGVLMSTARLVLRSLRQGLGRVMKVVLVLGLLYVGARLFGDDSVLRVLDVMEARVMTAWQRLREYSGMR
jgi:predicted RNA-binding Zn ribbon-like protein